MADLVSKLQALGIRVGTGGALSPEEMRTLADEVLPRLLATGGFAEDWSPTEFGMAVEDVIGELNDLLGR